jgi:uncharacterized membrane protein
MTPSEQPNVVPANNGAPASHGGASHQSGFTSIRASRSTILTTSEFSGPVPPPNLLAGYENVCPGLANRIFKMAEVEADHRRKLETSVVDANIQHNCRNSSESRRGQIFALIITLAGLVAGCYTALQGHDVAGGILGVGGMGGIVTTFVLGRAKSPKIDESPKPRTN